MIFEDTFISFPSRHPVADWEPDELIFEDIYFHAEDGNRLHDWYVPHREPRAHLLYCHTATPATLPAGHRL